MIEGKWFPQGSDLTLPLSIRQVVFGTGRDRLDDQAQQLVVYREGIPVGAARLWWQDGVFRAGDIGVLPAERGKGYGDLLVRLLIYKAVTHQATCVALQCPGALVAFFERYGFTVAQGDDPVEMRLNPNDECLGCGHCKG